MEVNELFKQRSITACMKASYNTVTSDIKSVVKQTWATHVPFAVLLAIVLYFLLPNKSLHDWGVVNPMASFILQTIITLPPSSWQSFRFGISCHESNCVQRAKSARLASLCSVFSVTLEVSS